MAFIDAIKYNQLRSMKGLPIGAILPWSGTQSDIPTGWIVCNGAVIENTKYPLLYEIIGNSYGGTVGSSFKIPPLTNRAAGIVDVFRGHFYHLQSKGDAHKPSGNNISLDNWWSNVGIGDNYNQGGNDSTDARSTIDLVGEQTGSPKFFGAYDLIEVSNGNYTDTASYTAEKLYDYHLTTHGHGVNNTEATALDTKNKKAVRCPNGEWQDASGSYCRVNCNRTIARRHKSTDQSNSRNWYGEVQSDMKDIWKSQPQPYGNVGGGGTGGAKAVGELKEAGTIYINGDGFCTGSMGCGNDILFTSRSNDETSISQVSAHEHGTSNYNFTGSYTVISPGIQSNIKLNTVKINNDPGQNFGTIQADTSTPSLDMLYIIRAY